jgi:Trk K+ transport system NAD-binding subunit
VALKRDDKYLIPDGLTRLKAGDKLLIIAGRKDIPASVSESLMRSKPSSSG